MNVVAVVPARGGSKGFPRKNLARFDGRTLVELAIAAGQEAASVSHVAVSTDDAEIAGVARDAGASIIDRPDELAGDEVGALPVIRHALELLAESHAIDAIAYLQPTSPLRTAAHVDRTVAELVSSGAEAAVTVVEVPHRFNPASLLQVDADGVVHSATASETSLRRQDKPRFVARNGPAVLVVRATAIQAGELYPPHTVAVEMSALESVDVDTPEDLLLAEAILAMLRHTS